VSARRDQLVLGAAAAALLIGIVGFAASGGVQEAPPTPTPAPTPVFQREQQLFGGDLAPGVRYSARVFTPAVSFEVGDGDWTARDTSDDDYLLLERRAPGRQAGGEYPGRSWLVFTRLPFVYDPRSGEAISTPRTCTGGRAGILIWSSARAAARSRASGSAPGSGSGGPRCSRRSASSRVCHAPPSRRTAPCRGAPGCARSCRASAAARW